MRNLRSAFRMCIRGASGSTEPGNRGCLQPLSMRQGLLPFVPNAVLPNGQFAILLEPSIALALDRALPFGLQVCGFAGSLLLDNAAQDVEVVHFTENVLKLLQVRAPRLVLLGQQTFHGVAEFLQANAKSVPGGWLVCPQRLAVQFLCFIQPLDGQALRGEASRGHEADPFAQLALQALPAFLIKFRRQPQRFLQQLRLCFLEEIVKCQAKLVVFSAVFGYPLVHDRRVTQLAELAEQLLWEPTHFVPSWIGIDFSHYRCDGAAASDGHT